MRQLPFHWNGEAMEPLSSFAGVARKQFVEGEVYILEPVEERSAASHKFYFACINEAWKNLPESIAESYPSPEHLRKVALIRAGYADETSIACSSQKQARQIAAVIRTMDAYAVILVRGATVRIFRAQSQSMHSMGKEAFSKSKQAVLDTISGLIGVDPATLAANSSPEASKRPQEPRQFDRGGGRSPSAPEPNPAQRAP